MPAAADLRSLASWQPVEKRPARSIADASCSHDVFELDSPATWAILGRHAVPARPGRARSRRRREWGTGAAADRRVHASCASFHRTDDPQRGQRICPRGARGAVARHRAALRLRRPDGVCRRTPARNRGARRGRRMAGPAAARELRPHRGRLPRIGRSAARARAPTTWSAPTRTPTPSARSRPTRCRSCAPSAGGSRSPRTIRGRWSREKPPFTRGSSPTRRHGATGSASSSASRSRGDGSTCCRPCSSCWSGFPGRPGSMARLERGCAASPSRSGTVASSRCRAARLRILLKVLGELYQPEIATTQRLRFPALAARPWVSWTRASPARPPENPTAHRRCAGRGPRRRWPWASLCGLARPRPRKNRSWPRACCADLRPYQREGVAWLQHLRALGAGGMLADDMGLGKTLAGHRSHRRGEAGRASRPAGLVDRAHQPGRQLAARARPVRPRPRAC